MTPPPDSPPRTGHAPPSERFRGRPRPGGPRVLAAAFAASIVLHGLAAVLLLLLGGRGELPPPLAAPPGPAPTEGMEVVRLSETAAPPTPVPDEPREPEPEDEAPAEEPEPSAVAADEPAEDEEESPGETATTAERLRPPPAEEGDARIWRPVAPERTALSPEDRARLRVYGRLDALADSLLTEEERARAAREWTYTDEDGRTWGVTPEGIHLGGFSIPLPFSFSRPPSADDAAARWEWGDVRRGAGAARVWETREERAEAIRERKNAERADTSGTGGR